MSVSVDKMRVTRGSICLIKSTKTLTISGTILSTIQRPTRDPGELPVVCLVQEPQRHKTTFHITPRVPLHVVSVRLSLSAVSVYKKTGDRRRKADTASRVDRSSETCSTVTADTGRAIYERKEQRDALSDRIVPHRKVIITYAVPYVPILCTSCR